MPDRYCRNCGNELRETDRYCSNCAAPVHETAHVPTPEADVEVPSPPQQAEAGRPEKKSSRNLLLFLALVVGLIWFLGSLGEDAGGSGVGGQGGNRQAAAPSDESEGSSETFTNENYAELYSDPAAHKEAQVNVTGQLLERPEDTEEELAFQMFADAENSEWNTIVYTDQTNLNLNTDDYVRVHGEVLGTFVGENAFGASLEAPMIQASKVGIVSAGQAIDPAKKVINVGQSLGDQGFEITLKKIEFGEESTRAYVTMTNNTGRGASFYTFDAKIQQGSTQVDYLEDSYAYYDEEPQSDLRPGVQTHGVLAFGPVNPDQPFRLIVPWESNNWSMNARAVVFQISP